MYRLIPQEGIESSSKLANRVAEVFKLIPQEGIERKIPPFAERLGDVRY